MGFGNWKPYLPVAERRVQAKRALLEAGKAGRDFAPVVLTSRVIAKTCWGRAWCDNLEAYSDFESRLPRGRAYVRSGAVIDLKIEPGRVIAQVMGSSLYQVEIGITALSAAKWKRLVADCSGSIATLLELLQGRFSTAVMARMCEPKSGLFPSPGEIRLGCSCPDWADMCKHVAAALYGVGARLDEKPELLFVLRQVDAADLLAAQAAGLPAKARKPAKAKVLADTALADMFGIEIATVGAPERPATRTGGATAARTPKPVAGQSGVKASARPANTAVTTAPAPEAGKKATRRKAAAPGPAPVPGRKSRQAAGKK